MERRCRLSLKCFVALQLSVEELKTNYEKEKAKLEEMTPQQKEPTPQGSLLYMDTLARPVWYILVRCFSLRGRVVFTQQRL